MWPSERDRKRTTQHGIDSLGGPNTELEEYPFSAEILIVIDLPLAVDHGCQFWYTPAKAVLTKEFAPPNCIRMMLNQKIFDPLAEPIDVNQDLTPVDKEKLTRGDLCGV